jgi:hypothetical protein
MAAPIPWKPKPGKERRPMKSGGDIYGRGLLLGQVGAYCDAVACGVKLAAQLGCQASDLDAIREFAGTCGCRLIVEPSEGGRCAVWIYQKPIARIVIEHLSGMEASPIASVVSGLLFGYSYEEIDKFVGINAGGETGDVLEQERGK